MTRRDVIRSINFGFRIAEEEIKDLAKYFVETEQWRQISSGNVDIVYGPKGSGKSALYALLLDKETTYFDRGVILVSAENPRGTPIFRDLVSEPPTSEIEFVQLWKLYFLSLVGGILQDYAGELKESRVVLDALKEAGLSKGSTGIHGLLKSAFDYIRKMPQTIEGEMKLDPLTGAHSYIGKIVFQEPTAIAARAGQISVQSLFSMANTALEKLGITSWILTDRLDVAFAETAELEANALRALFKAYLDLMGMDAIKIKIFLRSDIWRRITEGQGFREASHITKTTTIKWDRPSLANLVVRRAAQSKILLDYCKMTQEEALGERQSEFLARLFPDQVEVGPNKPETALDWILGHTKDGKKENAPRELIHFMSATLEEELRKLDLGEQDDAESLFSRQSIRSAWREVSQVRLTQTIYSEFPALRSAIEQLEGEKASQQVRSLSKLWGINEAETFALAEKLTEIGFFEKRGDKADPEFWVPFLYRPALNLVMGKAE
jgi:hypothetical protein